jgi:predicted XRE-type DNA-binding protein
MTARFDLMAALGQQVKAWNVTEEAAAGRLGVTRLQLDDLLNGMIDKFSLDILVALVLAAQSTSHEPPRRQP